MKVKVMSDYQVIQEALIILLKHFETHKFLQFVSACNLGQGDYLKLKDKLFEHETVDSLYEKIIAEREVQKVKANYIQDEDQNYYDVEADVLRINWSKAEIEKSKLVSSGVILNYDVEGNVIGIEILNASQKITNFKQSSIEEIVSES